ncbi:hypothetical protein QBC34DRAFT_477540 [Podospora aff. communis PSN243]|uniref:F-box domain-containing protein n=1 Tax=Podospora aff. communis PSN243 TaxID=3040156 RepID=A0AAV9G5W6_9PEZI|nr:hypothetical protein QBC34DRAFT_477540 [Podospora aff. communis PSN243]
MSTQESQFTPGEKVLTTVELLENILLHVDVRTVLVSAQRVCTAWHRVIASSKPLQRHLFFLPVADTPSPSASIRPNYIFNPLLVDAFPSFFPARHPIAQPQVLSGYLPLPPQYGFLPAAGDISTLINTLSFAPPNQKNTTVTKRHIALTYPSATWLKMLPSQPPPIHLSSLRAKSFSELRSEPHSLMRFRWSTKLFHRTIVEYTDGITMGELYTVVEEVQARCRKLVMSEGDPEGEVFMSGVDDWRGSRRCWVGWRVGEGRRGARVGKGGCAVRFKEGDEDAWLGGVDLLVGDRVLVAGL